MSEEVAQEPDEAGASELTEFGGTPYGQYPTQTRFLRADYKFYKTLDDSAEFAKRVAAAPPPPQPPQPPPLSRARPATAHPAGGCSRPQQQQQSRWREPEPGWRPVFPQPDLSSCPSVTDTAAPNQTDEQKTHDPPPSRRSRPLTAPNVLKPRMPSQTASLTPLAVVDFLERSPVPPPAPAPSPPPPPPPPLQQSPAVARFFRPKTAPARVAEGSGGGGGGGLQIFGQRLQPAARPTTAKSGLAEQQWPQADVASRPARGTAELSRGYDRALDVYGWRMEVPGDPFGIKREFLPERKPVSVKVPEPVVKPPQPRMRRSNRFTFFHTTAPRVVMSFDIHPNFTSEQFTKARAALVKQGKWDYSYRDFSFIY